MPTIVPGLGPNFQIATREKWWPEVIADITHEWPALWKCLLQKGQLGYNKSGTKLVTTVRTGTHTVTGFRPNMKPGLPQTNLFARREISWTGHYLGYWQDWYSKQINRGETAIFSAKKEEDKAAMIDWGQYMGRTIWLDNTNADEGGYTGIAAFMASTGSYMGWNLANARERPYRVDGTASPRLWAGASKTFAQDPRPFMDDIKINVTHGVEKDPRIGPPGAFFGDRAMYRHVKQSMQDRERTVNTGNNLRTGFEMFKWGEDEVYMDPFCPAQTLRWIDCGTCHIDFAHEGQFVERHLKDVSVEVGEGQQIFNISQFWVESPERHAEIFNCNI